MKVGILPAIELGLVMVAAVLRREKADARIASYNQSSDDNIMMSPLKLKGVIVVVEIWSTSVMIIDGEVVVQKCGYAE